ncbi:MAG: protein phosphatase 2C domain-containing protein [Desulfomonilaceae bacterium]
MTCESDLLVRGWSVPKRGENMNNDQWGWSRKRGRIALADGASTSSYSDTWARILVMGFIWSSVKFFEDQEVFVENFLRLQRQWHLSIPWARLEKKGWNYALKAKQGAHCTFLGVTLAENQWKAVSLGDCNLFVVSDEGEVRLCWPFVSGDNFDNYPDLIPSVAGSPVEEMFQRMQRVCGKVNRRENLIICTDALAAHLLKHKDNACLWQELLAIETHSREDFGLWVERLRSVNMRNDDTTAVVVGAPG